MTLGGVWTALGGHVSSCFETLEQMHRRNRVVGALVGLGHRDAVTNETNEQQMKHGKGCGMVPANKKHLLKMNAVDVLYRWWPLQ
jgi:hypothetical protein